MTAAAPVCRVCLAGAVIRFYIEDDHMLQIYRKLTSTELNTVQRPRGVCYICLSLLRKCCRFSEMVCRSDEILNDLLNQGIVVSDDMSVEGLGLQPTLSVAPMQSMTIDGGNQRIEDIDIIIKETEIISENNTEKNTVANDFSETTLHNNISANDAIPLFDSENQDMAQGNSYIDLIIKGETESVSENNTEENTLANDFSETTLHNNISANDAVPLFDSENQDMAQGNSYIDLIIKGETENVSENNTEENTVANDFSETISNDNISTNDADPLFDSEHQDMAHGNSSLENKDIKFELTIDEDFIEASTSNNTINDIAPTLKNEPDNEAVENITFENKYLKENTEHNKIDETVCEQIKISALPSIVVNIDNSALKVNTHGMSYICDICNKSFHKRYLLLRHMKIHATTFSCNICDKSFRQKSYLRKHLKTHDRDRPFPCDYCDKSYAERYLLLKHIKVHANTHTCNICNKSFARKGNLTKHMMVHTRVRPFSCQYCDKKFALNMYLERHLPVHTGEKQHKCQYCNKGFRHPNQLYRHIAKNTEGRFTCKYCKKVFTRNCVLVEHVNTHGVTDAEGDLYKCNCCNKSFPTIYRLKIHTSTHAKQNPFECKECDGTFVKRSSFIRHMRTHNIIYK